MEFPGFNEGSSLYRTKLHYHAAPEAASPEASVLPSFIQRCPGPAVEANWQPDGSGGGTMSVTGTDFAAGSTVNVTQETGCSFTPFKEVNVPSWGIVTCSPWTGCCLHTFFSVILERCDQCGGQSLVRVSDSVNPPV